MIITHSPVKNKSHYELELRRAIWYLDLSKTLGDVGLVGGLDLGQFWAKLWKFWGGQFFTDGAILL